jgi:mutT/NUDIX
MERTRVAAILKMENGYAFMHRKDVIKRKDYQEYYTFPGGGLEENETPQDGVIREIEEEFGIKVKVIKKLYEIKSEKFNQLEIFYLCEYISGTFGTGTGPEFSNDPKYIDSGKYLPEIIPQDKIKDILLLPQNVAKMFLEDLKNKKL